MYNDINSVDNKVNRSDNFVNDSALFIEYKRDIVDIMNSARKDNVIGSFILFKKSFLNNKNDR